MKPTLNRQRERDEKRQSAKDLAYRAVSDINSPDLSDKEAFGMQLVTIVTLLESIHDLLGEIADILEERQ